MIAALGPLLAAGGWFVRVANRTGLRRRVVTPYDLKGLDVLARRALGSTEAEQAFIRRYSSIRADLRHVRTANYLQDLVQMFRPLPPLASLRLPVLALLSRGGMFTNPAEMARRIAALPLNQIAWIDCHHWPLTERPLEVRTAIERWCESLD